MRKFTLLFLGVLMLSAPLFAQTDKENELQLEVGESLNIGYALSDNVYLYETPFGKSTAIVSDIRISPTFALTYRKKASNLVWYGVSCAWQQVSDFSLFMENKLTTPVRIINNVFAVTPSVKLTYYRSNCLQMYSGAEAGMAISFKNDLLQESKWSNIMFFGQLSAFGINYGKNFYIGTEIGFGYKGFINFTTGYRF